MEKAIICKGILKRFGEGATEVLALRGIDLELAAGKLLMVVGPSGSGKTTLISILAGILYPTEGECIILGENLQKLKNSALTAFRGKNIGFVFQAFNLIPMLTSKENVAIPLLLNHVELSKALAEATELLQKYGLQDKLEEFPQHLSGGQQQRVAIARSCIHKPRLIVCDEPTSYLDSETGIKVVELLREEVLKEGRTVIIVTHDERILSYADQIIKLEDGKIIA